MIEMSGNIFVNALQMFVTIICICVSLGIGLCIMAGIWSIAMKLYDHFEEKQKEDKISKQELHKELKKVTERVAFLHERIIHLEDVIYKEDEE